MNNAPYSKIISIKGNSQVRGIQRTVYEIANNYGIDATINSENYTVGLIFKTHMTEYTIKYSGDKDKVIAASLKLADCIESHNKTIREDEESSMWDLDGSSMWDLH